MNDIAKAIKAINPSAEFKYSNEDFSTLEWLNGTTPISQADIEAKQAELQAEYDALEYLSFTAVRCACKSVSVSPPSNNA